MRGGKAWGGQCCAGTGGHTTPPPPVPAQHCLPQSPASLNITAPCPTVPTHHCLRVMCQTSQGHKHGEGSLLMTARGGQLSETDFFNTCAWRAAQNSFRFRRE